MTIERLIELGVPQENAETAFNEIQTEQQQMTKELQTQLDEANEKLSASEFAAALKEVLKDYKFTSEFVKKSVEEYITGLGLPIKNGVLEGAKEKVDELINQNQGLIENGTKKPTFAGPATNSNKKESVEDLFYKKNPNIR